MSLFRFAVIASGLVALSACAGIREHRGFVIDPQLAEAIQPGVDNKDSVAKSLGRPTFTGQFDGNEWYYVSQDTHQFGPTRPKVVDATILKVSFDAAGNVTAVGKADETAMASIDPMKGQTPTLGRKRTFLQEILGNIGSVAQPGMPGGSSGPPSQ